MGLLARARFFATQLYIAAALWLPLCSSVSPLVHTLVASGPLGSDTPLSSGFSFFRASCTSICAWICVVYGAALLCSSARSSTSCRILISTPCSTRHGQGHSKRGAAKEERRAKRNRHRHGHRSTWKKRRFFLLISLIRTVDHQKRPACVCDAALVLVGFLISTPRPGTVKRGAANCQGRAKRNRFGKEAGLCVMLLLCSSYF